MKKDCHLSLSFCFLSIDSVSVHTVESKFSWPSTEQARWQCLYYRAAGMLMLLFPFGNWLMMICCGRATSLFFSPLPLLNVSCSAFPVPGPDHLPRWLWVQEGEPVHHRTGLRTEVQGRIQEAVLLDAGRRKMLLIFSEGRKNGDCLCECVTSVSICMQADVQ